MGMGVTSWPRESALPSPPRGACPGRLAQRSTGIALQAGCAREIAEIGPESGCDRVSLCQAESGRDCEIPDTGEVRRSRGARGRPRRGPGATRTRAQTPRCGPRGRPAAWPAPGLITRNRSAGTRRQAASVRPRPCPLAGGPQQRPRRAAGSRPVLSPRRRPTLPFPPRETGVSTSEAAPGAYLVILENDFGWDFLANDLPEDRVATRPGDLSLSDLICHCRLPPARPPGQKMGGGRSGVGAEGGSARPRLRWDHCSRGRAVLRVRTGVLSRGVRRMGGRFLIPVPELLRQGPLSFSLFCLSAIGVTGVSRSPFALPTLVEKIGYCN